MMSTNPGAAAFPFQPLGSQGLPVSEGTDGLTKRELLAAMAMQGLCSVGLQGTDPDAAVESDTQRAVQYADALLAALAAA